MCRAVMLPYHQRLALWLINDLRECPALPTLPTRRLRLAPLGFRGRLGTVVLLRRAEQPLLSRPNRAREAHRGAGRVGNGAYSLRSRDWTLPPYAPSGCVDGTETLQHATKQWRIRAASRDLGRTTPFFSHALVPPSDRKTRRWRKVVIDTRRQWLHVAIGSTLRTYHLHSRTLLLQREYDGRIECLERDSRLDALLIVVRSGASVSCISHGMLAIRQWRCCA
jgi:hypothetical protein